MGTEGFVLLEYRVLLLLLCGQTFIKVVLADRSLRFLPQKQVKHRTLILRSKHIVWKMSCPCHTSQHMMSSDVLATLKTNSLFYEPAILCTESTPRLGQARLQHLVVGHVQGYRGCCHRCCCCPGSEECRPAHSPNGKKMDNQVSITEQRLISPP